MKRADTSRIDARFGRWPPSGRCVHDEWRGATEEKERYWSLDVHAESYLRDSCALSHVYDQSRCSSQCQGSLSFLFCCAWDRKDSHGERYEKFSGLKGSSRSWEPLCILLLSEVHLYFGAGKFQFGYMFPSAARKLINEKRTWHVQAENFSPWQRWEICIKSRWGRKLGPFLVYGKNGRWKRDFSLLSVVNWKYTSQDVSSLSIALSDLVTDAAVRDEERILCRR